MRHARDWTSELPLKDYLPAAVGAAAGGFGLQKQKAPRFRGASLKVRLLYSLLYSSIVAAPDYAARVADSVDASGTGPQMYAEKTGVGSVLSPLEMMIPSGSADAISLRSFFIGFSLVVATRVARPPLKAVHVPRWPSVANDC
jgi:hypothetical protein